MINTIVDLSHHNTVNNLEAARAAGIMGVIHKATQGTGNGDPTFRERRAMAQHAGLLFGAYHFGTAGDAIGQADHFLSVAGPNTLLVLDFEGNPQGHDMSLEEAEHFVDHIRHMTGRHPGLYSGHTIKEALANRGITSPDQTELSKCWLWIAQYSTAPLLPKIWSSWTVWQYTDGAAGNEPHSVSGIGRCDRDQFNGSEEDLIDFWNRASGPGVQARDVLTP